METSKVQFSLSNGTNTTFEGTDEEVLIQAARYAQSKLGQSLPTSDDVATEGWETQSIWMLMRHIAPGPRNLLIELAKKPNGYPLADLKQNLGLSGNDIGGQLGSVTRIALRLFPNKPKFVHRDASTDHEFRMNQDLADAILDYPG
jgi:hypothetical protein